MTNEEVERLVEAGFVAARVRSIANTIAWQTRDLALEERAALLSGVYEHVLAELAKLRTAQVAPKKEVGHELG